MLSINWLSPSGEAVLEAHRLAPICDVPIAVAFAHVLRDAVFKSGDEPPGFAIRDVDGTIRYAWRADGAPVEPFESDMAPEQGPPPPRAGDRPRSPDRPEVTTRPPKATSLSIASIAGFARATLKAAAAWLDADGAPAVTRWLAATALHFKGIVPRRPPTMPSIEDRPVGSFAAVKLGVKVSSTVAKPDRAARFRVSADHLVLAGIAALVIVFGSPLYSIYATVRGINATNGAVLGRDIDVDHLRGSLDQQQDAGGKPMEGRSVAVDMPRVRLVGVPQNAGAAAEGDAVVSRTLDELVRGPAFQTLAVDGRIDFRRLFWHLRVANANEIDLLLSDAGGGGPVMVFRRATFLTWKLWDLRRAG